MRTRINGKFHIFATKRITIGVNEAQKKKIHIFSKSLRMKVHVMVDWNPEHDIIIPKARAILLDKPAKHSKESVSP